MSNLEVGDRAGIQNQNTQTSSTLSLMRNLEVNLPPSPWEDVFQTKEWKITPEEVKSLVEGVGGNLPVDSSREGRYIKENYPIDGVDLQNRWIQHIVGIRLDFLAYRVAAHADREGQQATVGTIFDLLTKLPELFRGNRDAKRWLHRTSAGYAHTALLWAKKNEGLNPSYAQKIKENIALLNLPQARKLPTEEDEFTAGE